MFPSFGKSRSVTTSSSNQRPARRPASRSSASKSSVSKAKGQAAKKNSESANPKQPCRVTVTEAGWHGARTAAIAAGCSSVSDMLEKLGSGELAVIASDAIALDPVATPTVQPPTATASTQTPTVIPQHIHYHTAATTPVDVSSTSVDDDAADDYQEVEPPSVLKLAATGLCALIIVGSFLYIADRVITITSRVFSGNRTEDIENIITPKTGDLVAGYRVSDEYGIRPFHPVTGAPNVPHNGVDLAMDVGTPIHAVGKEGDSVEVKCWWDIDGGGWVVNQTAESYPGYVFQSLHMSENGCREGVAEAGEAIAYSGNSGLGTGAHYDFRVKVDGSYVPPSTKYLESAVTGKPPRE